MKNLNAYIRQTRLKLRPSSRLIGGFACIGALVATTSCRQKSPEIALANQSQIHITQRDELRNHRGVQLKVTGKAFVTKAGPGVGTQVAGVRLHDWNWPDELIGTRVTVIGELEIIDAHVAPIIDEEMPIATDEPGGTNIPDRYVLRNVELVDSE